ncbi:sterile alpha motif domain-containing protein 9-like isoform X1 [Oculina patagonica]
MEAKNEDSDDSEYQVIFTALDELKLGFLKPFFKKHLLEDDTLFYMASEEELKSELRKLGLPFGQAFKFSRHWFINCHTHKETASSTKSSGDGNQNIQPEELPSEFATALSRNVQQDTRRSVLKDTQDSAKYDEGLISCDVKETEDSVGLEYNKTQQHGKEGHFESQPTLEQPHITSHVKDDFTGSSPVNVEGVLLKEGLPSCEQKLAAQNENYNGDNQSVHHSASKESQERNTEENGTISSGNCETFSTTTINKTQYEDGLACGTQQGTDLDPRTVRPKTPQSSSKQKDTQSSKKQQKRAGEAQSNTGHKCFSKGVVPIDSTQQEGKKAEHEHEGFPRSDANNSYMAEKTSSSDSASVSSQSAGTTVTEEPDQSVEKVPPVPIASSSSIPQIAGMPPITLQKGGAKKQSLSTEGQNAQSVQVSKCIARPFGVKVTEKSISYKKGSVIDGEENKEVEYKSFSSARPSILPWKIMEKAKKFICACLNAGSKGIIYFGVGDNQEQGSKFHHGEVIGLEVENIKDDITKALQFLLDDHIRSDDGKLQKGGEQNCIDIHFVPVKCQENVDTSLQELYVVEIEVHRDWRFCKENVYHSKSWIEKQGGSKDPTRKKAGLHDIFKVKDTLDDVAVRTKGASACVKQDEIKRQVRDPLMTKYEEWKREAKFGASELTDGLNPDDPDFKRFNKMVRERFFDLNIKEYHYILVANKVPPQYRGTPHLSFLKSIPWVAVFDLFDASSRTNGLYFICNEMSDARRANVKTLDDFKDISTDWTANNDCPIFTRGTTWILQLKKLQDEEWITLAKDCFYRALSAYKQCFPSGRLIIAILGLGENAIMEMSDIAESCFSILGGNIAKKCVTIISESKAISDALIQNSKPALRKQLMDCSISDMSWSLLKEIVREMVGPAEFKDRDANTKLPYITGQKEVLNKFIHSWDDLEVYCPEPRLQTLTENIEKARDAFYKGTQASQMNLFYNHTIERTLEEVITQKIEQAVKSLGSRSSDRTGSVKTVTVPYEPGSGATTLCRRILWNKRKDYRCAVVKAITKATDFQIDHFQGIGYDKEQKKFSPPVLVLVDNFTAYDTRGLSERLITRETKCIIIATYPVETTGTTIEFDIKPLRQLDDKEMSHVRNILINITKDLGRRREAEEVLEREKRFIWFGLELFGREYVKIKERLHNHIKSTLAFLGNCHAIYEKLLHFCCFLHFYSNGVDILPHSFVVDFLYEESDETGEKCAQTASIHDKFGGLLLEGYNESYGYHGWRPAHSLVSEVVKSRMKADEIAVQLLENAEKGRAYVNKFLSEQLFQILLHRKRVSNLVSLPKEEETPEDNIGSDIAAEDQKCYEVRTRYSPLILDILGGDDGRRRTLELLITVCEKAKKAEDRAYAWQQLARFMGYEMRFEQLESKDALHSRLYDAIHLSKLKELQLPMPETGIKAAHIAIDIAIDQQPNYSHHYTTKGVLYSLQLRDVNTEDGHNLVSSMPGVIDVGRKALQVYDQARQRKIALNFYSVIGKIQIIVLLLKIFKSLPCFCLENNTFTRYLEEGEIPREMVDFLQEKDHNFVQDLGPATLELINKFFKDVKYRQLTTCDDTEFKNLSTANTRACKLREEFYEITGFDRSKLVPTEGRLSPLSKEEPKIFQQVVQDILFKNNETSYSGWYNLGNQVISSIYRLLKPLCLQSNGNHDDMLIFSRVCLRLSRQEKPPVEELDNVVQKWVKKFPDSAWAHLFNYMIHFPIPNRSLLATNLGTLASINKCCEMVQKRTGWRARKSAAEYFLGKGTGLIAIVSRKEFPELQKKWSKTKTDFWRSKEVSETLIRVRGQKHSQGVITYQDIRLSFDDMLYPNESKDDLWFYVGFSVAGPYAFDPVDDDTYSTMARKPEKRAFDTRSFKGGSNAVGRGAVSVAGPRRRKPREMSSGIQRNPDASENCPTTSYVQNFQEQLPSEHFNVPSPLASNDTLHDHRPAATATPPTYASALKHGGSSQEKEVPSAENQISQASAIQKRINWKSIRATRGKQSRVFQPMYVDPKGKLHHGSRVLGAFKSQECRIHTSTEFLRGIDRCTFAHSWRGDTIQSVCTKCTEENKPVCREKKEHQQFIWALGPYYTEYEEIWKGFGQEHLK